VRACDDASDANVASVANVDYYAARRATVTAVTIGKRPSRDAKFGRWAPKPPAETDPATQPSHESHWRLQTWKGSSPLSAIAGRLSKVPLTQKRERSRRLRREALQKETHSRLGPCPVPAQGASINDDEIEAEEHRAERRTLETR
jgi:hypothetical protein